MAGPSGFLVLSGVVAVLGVVAGVVCGVAAGVEAGVEAGVVAGVVCGVAVPAPFDGAVVFFSSQPIAATENAARRTRIFFTGGTSGEVGGPAGFTPRTPAFQAAARE